MKLVGYCRVSTDNQKEEGTIGLQRNALRDYAKRGGHELVEVFEDEGVSGGMEDRPGLAGLFAYVEENGDVDGVLIYKLDRLARDLYIQEHLIKQLEKLDKKLVSCKEPDLESGDPMRKAFRQFMGIVAELEKAYITMRLSGGRIEKAKRGKYAGGRTAYGYSAKDKELCVDQERAEVIRESEGISKALSEAIISHPLIRKNIEANTMALPEVELVGQGALVRLTRAKKLIVDER